MEAYGVESKSDLDRPASRSISAAKISGDSYREAEESGRYNQVELEEEPSLDPLEKPDTPDSPTATAVVNDISTTGQLAVPGDEQEPLKGGSGKKKHGRHNAKVARQSRETDHFDIKLNSIGTELVVESTGNDSASNAVNEWTDTTDMDNDYGDVVSTSYSNESEATLSFKSSDSYKNSPDLPPLDKAHGENPIQGHSTNATRCVDRSPPSDSSNVHNDLKKRPNNEGTHEETITSTLNDITRKEETASFCNNASGPCNPGSLRSNPQLDDPRLKVEYKYLEISDLKDFDADRPLNFNGDLDSDRKDSTEQDADEDSSNYEDSRDPNEVDLNDSYPDMALDIERKDIQNRIGQIFHEEESMRSQEMGEDTVMDDIVSDGESGITITPKNPKCGSEGSAKSNRTLGNSSQTPERHTLDQHNDREQWKTEPEDTDSIRDNRNESRNDQDLPSSTKEYPNVAHMDDTESAQDIEAASNSPALLSSMEDFVESLKKECHNVDHGNESYMDLDREDTLIKLEELATSYVIPEYITQSIMSDANTNVQFPSEDMIRGEGSVPVVDNAERQQFEGYHDAKETPAVDMANVFAHVTEITHTKAYEAIKGNDSGGVSSHFSLLKRKDPVTEKPQISKVTQESYSIDVDVSGKESVFSRNFQASQEAVMELQSYSFGRPSSGKVSQKHGSKDSFSSNDSMEYKSQHLAAMSSTSFADRMGTGLTQVSDPYHVPGMNESSHSSYRDNTEDIHQNISIEPVVGVSIGNAASITESIVQSSMLETNEIVHASSGLRSKSIEGTKVMPRINTNCLDFTTNFFLRSVNPQTGEYEYDPGPLAIDFYCNICQRSLPLGSFRLRCAECQDFDLCVACACQGITRNDHESDHSYIPISPNTFYLFGDWTADEELLLLEGISKYGFGNWNQVAELVNGVSSKHKSAAECEHHYNEYYIHSQCSPFPDITRIRQFEKNPEANGKLIEIITDLQSRCYDFRIDPDFDTDSNIDEEDLNHIDLIPPRVNIPSAGPPLLKFFQHFNGYNLYRDELETEFNNDAEMLIKDLEFEPWDTPAEIEFKLRLVEIYNCMLDDRIRHKRILIHRFWHDYPARDSTLQSMNQAERTTYWRLSPLMRLHSEEEHTQLTKLIVTRTEIEKRLRLLGCWYSLGLRTRKDISSFEPNKLPSSLHFSGGVDEIHHLSRKLVHTGQLTEREVSELTEQMLHRLCYDLVIDRQKIEQFLSELWKLRDSAALPLPNVSGILPSWDFCIQDGKMLRQNQLPQYIPPVMLNLSGQDWHPRIVVERDVQPTYPDVNFNDLRFSASDDNVIMQSNVVQGSGSCIYFAQYHPQLKVRSRKPNQKKRKQVYSSEGIKRVHVQR